LPDIYFLLDITLSGGTKGELLSKILPLQEY